MDELQRYLREKSVDSKIASSVQKNIKNIVAKDGDIDCVNDRLNAFTATSTGQKILGIAQKIMQEIKLPYSEQVFLQESGFYPDKGTDHKGGKKESPTVASLLEMYATLEKPIAQIDGLADESDGIPLDGSLQFDDTFKSGHSGCFSPYATPTTLSPNTRFKRQFLKAFARGEALDSSGEGGWETTDGSAMTTLPNSTMGSVQNISGVSPINWTQSNARSVDDSGWETTLSCSSPHASPATLSPNTRFKRQFLKAFARGEALDSSAEGGWETIDDSAMTTLPESTMGSVQNISVVSPINCSQFNGCSADDSGWETTLGCSSAYPSPATLSPNTRFKRQFLKAFARGEALDSSGEGGWQTIDDSAMTTLPSNTMGSAQNISGVSPINWTKSNACSADESGWETTLGSSAGMICGLEEESILPSDLSSMSSRRRPRSMSVNRRSPSGIIRRNRVSRSPRSHSASRVETSPNRSVHYSTLPSDRTCSRLGSSLRQSGNVVPRQSDWNHFDSENPAHEQRFFEINDMQKTYLGTALNMLDVLPIVVQVGHTIILNADVFVDERDTKQFTIGGLLPDYLEQDNRSTGQLPRRDYSRRSSSLSTPCTPRSPRLLRTPGAPAVAHSGGRSPRGGYGRRLNFSRESQGSMNCTPVMATPLAETPRTPNVGRRMRSPRSARAGRQLSFQESPLGYSIDAEEPFIVQGRCTRDAVGRPMAIVGPRRHGFFPDENEDLAFVDPNLTPVQYAEFELPDEFEIDMMRGQ